MKQRKKIKSFIDFLIVFSFSMSVTTFLIIAENDLILTQSLYPAEQHELIIDDNLIATITAIVDEAVYNNLYQDLPESIKRCYMYISQGIIGLPVNDVMQALPTILNYSFGQIQNITRAQRDLSPNAPIVGPGVVCDLKPVLALLNLIKNRIGCVDDPVCCNTILGILGNACEIFGPDTSISSILLEILNEINGTQTIICTIPCSPTPLSGPTTITEPGTYCLTKNIIGSIIIDSDNVAIELNEFEITALSPGIQIVGGHHNIIIRNGTIIGGNNSQGIEARDCTNIEILNVSFNVDNIGITFNNIKNFIINNTQFTNYTDSVMSFTNSSNGKVVDSQIHNNNTTAHIPILSLINLDDCQQLIFNNIVMTENSNIQTLRGINAVNTHESSFENIQVTFNQTIQNLEGIHLENCDNNSIKQYTVNKNNLSSSTSSATLVGINITASVDGGSKNNNITECQIHDNTNNVTGEVNSAILIGVNIAGAISSSVVSNNVGANTTINATSIISNTCTSQGNASNSFLVGINLASAINGGSIGADTCANCNITNCTVTQNNNTSQDGAFSTAQFIGINLAGIFSTINPTSVGTIAANACKNCHITLCNVSNNSCSINNAVSSIRSFPILICINLASIHSFSELTNNAINDNACASCSISNCSLNNNNCNSNSASIARFFGINFSSGIGNIFTIGNNACASCSINNCNINNNSCTNSNGVIFIGCNFADPNDGDLGTNICESCLLSNCAINNNTAIGGLIGGFSGSLFFGINFSRSTGADSPTGGNSCNNCYLDTISITQNTLTDISSAFFFGIAMNGVPATFIGGCNNITCNQCFIEDNTSMPNTFPGDFNGFFIMGNGNNNLAGGCNNIILKSCEVNRNFYTGGLHAAYRINNGGTGGVDNIQFENCTAKQNTSVGTFDGFNAFGISNALWLNCISAANSSNGFLVQSAIDSALRECEAFNNGTNGFNFSGTTQQVTIINSQSLGNLDDGFSFATTTTQCHIRANIAQNNNGIGFDNEGGDVNKHQFFGNFAQGNGTNYSGIALVTSPNLTTSSFANVET